jgi:hypothetical protein
MGVLLVIGAALGEFTAGLPFMTAVRWLHSPPRLSAVLPVPTGALTSAYGGTAVPQPSAVTAVRTVHTCNIGLHVVGHATRRHGCAAPETGRNRRGGNSEILPLECGLRPFLTLAGWL